MITLHIKGDEVTARRAARERGLRLLAVSVRERGGVRECLARVHGGPSTEFALASWMGERVTLTAKGYPPGSLLFYS